MFRNCLGGFQAVCRFSLVACRALADKVTLTKISPAVAKPDKLEDFNEAETGFPRLKKVSELS